MQSVHPVCSSTDSCASSYAISPPHLRLFAKMYSVVRILWKEVLLLRVVIADCSAVYTGRGDTKLGRGVRSVIIKADGSVSIHNDSGNKPLNYMKTALHTEQTTDEGFLQWTFDFRRESLTIVLYEVLSDQETALISADEDAGLVRDGTEDDLQEWIYSNPAVLGEGYEAIQREFQTGDGPVDIFAYDSLSDVYEVVEVKRTATIGAVDQVLRYREAMNTAQCELGTGDFGVVRASIAALDIRPKAVQMAKRKGVRLVWVPLSWRKDEVYAEPPPSSSRALSIDDM